MCLLYGKRKKQGQRKGDVYTQQTRWEEALR